MFSRDIVWTQELEFSKQWENKYNSLLFCAGLFTSFTQLNRMVWLENTFNCQLPVKNRKIFYLALLIMSFINFRYSQVLEFLNGWDKNFVHTWDTQNKILGMIWDMLSGDNTKKIWAHWFLKNPKTIVGGGLGGAESLQGVQGDALVKAWRHGCKAPEQFFFFFSYKTR